MDITASFFTDTVLVQTISQTLNVNTTTGANYTFGGSTNFDNLQTLKATFEINDFTPPPLTGSRVLEYRVLNNTTESIDKLWWAFDFNDTPNIRLSTEPGEGLATYLFYISASNVPTGSSVYSSIVNFTASLSQPPNDYNLFMDADSASTSLIYNYQGILRQDGVQQATFTALSASSFNQFPTASYLNPMTWVTCSFELTASRT